MAWSPCSVAPGAILAMTSREVWHYVLDEADTMASRHHEMVLLADLDHEDKELLSRLRQLH